MQTPTRYSAEIYVEHPPDSAESVLHDNRRKKKSLVTSAPRLYAYRSSLISEWVWNLTNHSQQTEWGLLKVNALERLR